MTFEFREEGHIYLLNGVRIPGVTEVLPWGYGSGHEFQRLRGKHVHSAIQLFNEGVLDEDSLDPQLLPYLSAYRKFREEHDLNGIYDIKTGTPHPCTELQLAGYYLLVEAQNFPYGVLLSEVKTYHSVYRFAGTIDFAVIYKMPCPVHALYLQENGGYKLVDHTKELRKNIQIFLSFLTTYKWTREKNLM